jgi:N-acetylglucosaminyldiphosphoundecaprenol N-acetyl-beta-D-mannosaminyltransferase
MRAKPPRHTVSVLGCDIDALTLTETVAEVDRLIRARRPVQHCVINAAKAVMLERDERLREILSTCALVNADGQSVVWASRLLGRPLPARVTGIDLFAALLCLAERRGYGVYFLGATLEVVQEVVERARREHPSLCVSGSHDGYLRAEDTEVVVAEVRAQRPQILFVGMPSPQKEYWLAENLRRLNVPFSMGVGGSFDVYVGRVKRAPLWMQQLGLEWFYRFAQEPTRMWRRYLVGNIAFLNLVRKHRRSESVKWGRRRGDRVDGWVT